ncbi:efflux RND transporter periplasmic adaptor subunit [Flavobacterium sp.]|jgi:Cu(I)/Ag(I) efflux system membrane fusion protein|uniref:efflux RND transporter periplasmic adaptor subunit n=1 Tax=Flavobacterium sp. TaxID=239 RepID=UPI0026135C1D|nr:efflux RND transporter periplasmic adaptor subunit [Flavobacterium sp.]MDG2432003.1 efflux RND transporter periplasmic adaptor subunit [Flavobacterium sp.]
MIFDKKTKITLVATLIIGLILGALLFGGSSKQEEKNSQETVTKDQIWTCSMHPQIRKNEPGACPICGMDLIPLETSENSDIDPNAISMSESAMIIAGVSTYKVGNSDGIKEIALNGKVEVNEKGVYSQSSHIPGRIEKILVTFTGEYVRKGQVVAYVYSPELASAQQELLEAYSVKDIQPQLLEAVKQKLKNWRVSETTIKKVIQSGKAQDKFAITADVSGYVVKKNVELGDYVQRGQTLYEVADLSKVWVLFEIYETEIGWIKKGDKVNYTIASFPGESFSGTISFIDPFINPSTRIAKARIEVNNSNLKLKPEMFVSGIINSKMTANKSSLSVPKSAVMWTGKRSIVYIKNESEKGISFKLREVTLGPLLGSDYIIEEGLEAGEEIAVNGTFNIDAAAQLAGKPSMMNIEGGKVNTGHDHGGMKATMPNDKQTTLQTTKTTISTDAKASLQPLYKDYFELKDALTKDDFNLAKNAISKFEKSLNKINMNLFKGDAHKIWMNYQTELKNNTLHAAHIKDIKEMRKSFESISNVMIAMTKSFKPLKESSYIQFCPMANNDKGANWLSKENKVVNPYFGASMSKCGEVKQTIK